MTEFERFIKDKPMSYTEIDILRMAVAFDKIKDKFDMPRIIHVIGTNGKGSTGRFIAEMLLANGNSVGHYTSPHISHINERFWINGELATDHQLELVHKVLQSYLSQEEIDLLTYFEYTTLMALPLFEVNHWLVMEAGLGGEFDATNVFPKVMSVVTPIGFDHQKFLGNTIQEIASTKLRSMAQIVIIARQEFDEVYKIADKIAKTQNSIVHQVTKQKKEFLADNFTTAKLAVKLLGMFVIKFNREDFKLPRGRLEKISKNLFIDVGHNLLAVDRVLADLPFEKFHLIYNSLSDKPFREILAKFKNRVESVEIILIDDERAVNISELSSVLDDLEIKYKIFHKIKKSHNYLVFGSFRTVEKFLEFYEKEEPENIYENIESSETMLENDIN